MTSTTSSCADAAEQLHYPPELPVSAARERLLAAMAAHQVLVICGDTGSGKTTQLPKMCIELGRGRDGRIGHTQPRRIAARNVAARIAHELGEEPGTTVGWKVRFSDRTGEHSRIKLMTDGILLSEIRHDRDLRAYDTLIIDEAHERSLNIDFLLGYLQRLLPRRPDLKLLITSATIDPERFSRHFADAPIINVEGRTYPVEMRYRPLLDDADSDRHERDLERGVTDAVRECMREGSGDILVFLPGERQIHDIGDGLRQSGLRDIEVLKLYSRLSVAEQQKVFAPHRGRRVVLATNVAETSLTVPGIRFVVDSGEARISRYSLRSKIQRLPVEKISQASADQRAGRCGRLGPGICIRLYDEDDYAARARYTDPEILRTSLASVVLQMNALRLGPVEDFPFIDPPERRLVNDGYTTLYELGAVDEYRRLTRTGRKLARLSVDPRLGRILLAGADEGALAETLVVAAALAIQDPRERPAEARAEADAAHAAFSDESSDFLFLLNLWRFWQARRDKLSQNRLRKVARQHFLSWMRMREWIDLHAQLAQQVRQLGLRANTRPAAPDAIHRALLAGLLSQVAVHEGEGEYLSTRNRRVFIFPGSMVAGKTPKWIVAAEISETSRVFARFVAGIDRRWIERLGDHLMRRSYSNPRWQRRAQRVAADEQSTLYGLVINPKRRVNYGPIDPAESRRIFIRHALVRGELDTKAEFLARNRQLAAEIEALEDRARSRDILVDEETLHDFYDGRIAQTVFDGPSFHRWYRQAVRQEPDLLLLTREHLLQREADEVTATDYPDHMDFSGLKLPLNYHFAPGSDDDGVTLTIPRAAIRQVPAARCDWLVPGMRREKIEALLRSLPKRWRRNHVPVPDFAHALHQRMTPDDAPMTEAMSRELEQMTGDGPPADAWNRDQLDTHLHMRFRIIDEDGETLDTGRDLEVLALRHGDAAALELDLGESDFERDDVQAWDFGELPESVERERHGISMRVHPALHARGERIALTVFATKHEAEQAHHEGVRTLIRRVLARQIRDLERNLEGLTRAALHFGARIDGTGFTRDVIDAAIERACLTDYPLPHDADAFARCVEHGRAHLHDMAAELVRELDCIGERYRRIRRRTEGNLPMTWIETVRDVTDQLEWLVFPGFIAATPTEWLTEFPRYLDAIDRRLDVLDREPERDRRARAEILALWERIKGLLPADPRGIRWSDPDIRQARWMMEELRVSLFAQQLGTKVPVSTGRLEKLLPGQ